MKKLILIILCSLGLCSNLYSQGCVNNITPSNGATIYRPTPTLWWSDTCTCSAYCPSGCYGGGGLSVLLKVATNPSMSNVVYSWTTTNGGVNFHTIPANILQNNITYWWNVSWSFSWICIYHWPECMGGGGSCGPFSSTPFSFVTAFLPNPPSNLTALAVSSSKIDLNWRDNSNNEIGFNIQISTNGGTSYFLRASTGPNIVTYADTGLIANTIYHYRVYAYNVWGYSAHSNVAFDTTFPPIGIITINSEIPKEYKLYRNYPNPFNPTTKIRFDIPVAQISNLCSLKIFDALGREVATLVNEQLKPGTYEVEWNASNYPSGVYYYKLSTGEFSETRKAVLIK